ncbi:predicted protein, partial [Nematostella vectensis]
LITLVGNLLTLLILYRNKNLWTPTNLLIASLAASDFTFSISNVFPLGTGALSSREWPFSFTTCQYQGFISIMMATQSTQTLGCMALNRFYRVVKPRMYPQVFSLRNTICVISLTWILAMFAPVLYLASGHKFVFIPAKAFCYMSLASGSITAFIVATYIGIPALLIGYCYLRVYLAVRKHKANLFQANTTISPAEIKVTKTLVVTVLVFMCCWGPILIIDVIDVISGRWVMPRWVYILYVFFSVISSSANPVIYVFMNPTFKREFLSIL